MSREVYDDGRAVRQDERGAEPSEYYQERYEHIRPTLPASTGGRLVVAGFGVAIAAFTVQALVPAGTPPNSIEPWVGPLPFSFAWLFAWAVVLQVLMVVAYVRWTGE